MTQPISLKALAVLAIAAPLSMAASAQTSMKLVMDWAFDGPQAVWTSAGQSSCFPDKNLKVQIDRGFGSGDSIGKVASGAYDIGVADFASIVAYNAQHPENKLLGVFIISDLSPTSVTVLKSSGITKPKDLEGKKIADSQGEASRVLFPAFAKKNGVDLGKITWVNVAPNLRQTSVVQGQADAAAGHMFTVTAKPAYLASHKKEVTDFLGCLAYGIKYTVDNPKAAVATLKPYNSLVDEAFEINGLEFSTSRAIATPYVIKNGLSVVDPARMDAALGMIAESISIPKPTVAETWTSDYLPPLADRQLTKK